MDMMEIPEIFKNSSDAIKNIYELIEKIWQPNLLNNSIKKGESKIIDSLVEKIVDDIKNGKGINQNDLFLLFNFKKQIKEIKNCSQVLELASLDSNQYDKLKDIDDDWFSFFFDKVRLVSDQKMQKVWSQILSGEISEQGKFQRSLIHILSIMNSEIAEDFCNLLRFSFYDINDYGMIHPFVFLSSNFEAYKNSNITMEKLMALQNLGLVQCDLKDEFIFNQKKHFRIGNYNISVIGDENNNYKIKAGNVILTKDGQALASIVGPEYKKYRPDIFDFIIHKLLSRNCTVYVNNKLVKE